jgi:hypothetical protein
MRPAGTMHVTFLVHLVCNPNQLQQQKSHPQGGFFAFWGALTLKFVLLYIGRIYPQQTTAPSR